MTNTRFAIAVHILAFIDACENVPATSEMLAASVGTNPAFVRRILSQLNKAGLTRSQMGTGGGALLAKSPKQISLLDVYNAINDSPLFPVHVGPNANCPVGRNIEAALNGEIAPAQEALLNQLRSTSLSALVGRVRELDRHRPLQPVSA